MASVPYAEMNDTQRRVKRVIDLATDTVIAYAAKEVPSLGNLTKEGMVEELGRMNEARKAIEKTEKILKERLKSMLDGAKEVKSDNYQMKYEDRPRTALDQGKAKEYFESQGTLADYMETTSVPTMTIKPIGA
jgi:hypothetical protein